MLFVSAILLGAIGTRLAFLQIIQGEDYREKAEDNRVRIVPKPPVRGNIFDRKGRVLASTRLTHAAYLWPIVVNQPDWAENRKYLAQLLSIPEESIENKIKQAGYNASTLIRIARSLNPAQITALEEFKNRIKRARS
jgi:penicillin-binding protein 2